MNSSDIEFPSLVGTSEEKLQQLSEFLSMVLNDHYQDLIKMFYEDDNGNLPIQPPGGIKISYLSAAPSTLENGMIWMESDGLHLYYDGAEKVVAGV